MTSPPGDQVVALTTVSTVIINLINWALTAYAWKSVPQPVEAALTLAVSGALGYGAVLLAYWRRRVRGTLPPLKGKQ